MATAASSKPPNKISLSWYVLRTLLRLILRRPLVGMRAIPLLKDGRIVLVKSRRGGWELPGGLLDFNEKFHASIAREVLEECGMEVYRFGRLSGIYSDPQRDLRYHSICIVMEVFVQGEPSPQDIFEIQEAKIFSLDSLPEDLAEDCIQQLKDYLAGQLIVD